MENFLSNFDFFRKVPRTYSKGSEVGGVLSLVALLVCGLVVLLEVVSFFSVEHLSHVELDHSTETSIYINFNVTLHNLRCDFAKVMVKDLFSDKERNAAVNSVNKLTLDGAYQGTGLTVPYVDYSDSYKKVPEYYRQQTEQKENLPSEEENKQTQIGHDLVVSLDEANFDDQISQYLVSYILFYAPWCEKCNELQPVFDRAAFLVKEGIQKLSSDVPSGLQKVKRNGNGILLGRVDCTKKESFKLCRKHGIQVFPTISIFGTSKRIKEMELDGFDHHYNGMRNATSISAHAFLFLHSIVVGDDGLDKMEPKGGNSQFVMNGCRLEGAIPMNKIPTELIFKAHSDFHSLNTSLFSLDHTINHLSVGKMLKVYQPISAKQAEKLREEGKAGIRERSIHDDIRDRIMKAYHDTHGPKSLERIGKSSGLVNDVPQDFKTSGVASFDHYVRVVPISLFPRFGTEKQDYDYTFESNLKTHSYGEIPEVTVKVEISPLRLILEEKSKSLSGAFLNLMSLIGGIYSSFMIFNALFIAAVDFVAKKMD